MNKPQLNLKAKTESSLLAALHTSCDEHITQYISLTFGANAKSKPPRELSASPRFNKSSTRLPLSISIITRLVIPPALNGFCRENGVPGFFFPARVWGARDAARRACRRQGSAAHARHSGAARPAQDPPRQKQNPAQQLEHTLHRDAQNPKRQQEQPHKRIKHQRQQGQRPAQHQQNAPQYEFHPHPLAPSPPIASVRHFRAVRRYGTRLDPVSVVTHILLIRSKPEFRSLRAWAWHERADLLNYQVDSDVVVPAFRNDHIGVALRRLDKLQMHRPHGLHVLVHDHLRGAPAIAYIAHQAPDEAQVRVGIHEDFDVQHVAQRFIFKYQNAFHNYGRARFNAHSSLQALKVGVIVGGALNRLACAQLAHMLGEQRRVHGIGMIEIHLHAFGEGHPRIIAVVIVLLQNYDVRFGKRFDDAPRDGGLAGAGAAANSNDKRPAIRRRKSRGRNGELLVETVFCAPESCSQRPLGLAFFPSITACAAANRAIATRNGEALT